MKLHQYQNQICDQLSDQGWIVLDQFFDDELIERLGAECRAQDQLGLLREAGIGKGTELVVDKNVRGDATRWLEPGMSEAGDQFLVHMQGLRDLFNQTMYLGLDESEHHFAAYPPGSFYQKHLDRFRADDRRTVSAVLYLNPAWEGAHAGQLRIYPPQGTQSAIPYLDVEPLNNRLILFMSDQISHEVLPTQAPRHSLTGWFKRRA